jgi:RimJ/RimL family protein N-acetyltransferase
MLRGESIVLTNVRPADKEVLFGWINDPDTVRFNAPYAPVSWEDHCRWFEGIGGRPDRVLFAVRMSPDDEIIGTVQFLDIHPVHRSAELRIRIGSGGNRGKGYGTEALKLAIAWGFNDLNLERIWLRVFANNGPAMRAYEKAGLVMEGTMRRAAFINGEWLDQHIMAILRTPAMSGRSQVERPHHLVKEF